MNEAVLAAGDRETGATVHLVEGEYDSGPVRFLSGADHAAYRILRLRMLREEPTAFGSNYETALDLPEAHFRECVRARMKNFIAGGFVGTDLVGSAGGYREGAVKRRHFATIWSMYVFPASAARASRQCFSTLCSHG